MSDSKATTMKALAFYNGGKAADVFQLLTLPIPTPGARDLLVRVLSAASNPVDTKVRKGYKPPADEKDEKKWPAKVVGWDAAGVVVSVGAECKLFKAGDEVFFAGAVNRAGSFAEYVAVDERIVGAKPKKLTWDQAASVPLVAITAWEGLTEQLGISQTDLKTNSTKSILVVGGAGGVGSLVTQIAKNVLKIGKVISTASRKETEEFTKKLGADVVIDHKKPLLPQLEKLGYPQGVDYVFNTAETEGNFDEVVTAVAPFGRLVLITGSPNKPLNIHPLFYKRASVSFEFMFARPIHGVERERQHALLSEVSRLLDAGTLVHTLTKSFPFTVDGIVAASVLQESGSAIGKIGITVAAK